MLNFAGGMIKYIGIVLVTANSYAAEPVSPVEDSLSNRPVYCSAEAEKQIESLEMVISLSRQKLKLVGILDEGERCILLKQKVIIGKKDWRTPKLESKISSAVINPSWYPTPNILEELEEEYSKKYVEKNFYHEDGIYMSPGKKNPLGKVKFPFPNEYRILIHGTKQKDKRLFKKKKRYFSHGCIRVENEVKLLKKISQIAGTRSNCDDKCIDGFLSSGGTKKLFFKKPVKLRITK